jgi:transposase
VENSSIIFIGMDTHKESTDVSYAGDLSAIYVPSEEDEAIRDISRAREAAMSDRNDARYRLKALLLRNNIQYKGTANWSLKHLRWLNEIVLPHAAQHFVLQEMILTITERNVTNDCFV